jgi:pheromone receptor transcription factor
VLLLVVSETGLVYTFTTAKLQPLVTQPEGKNLIQACLNAPHGQVPSSMPVGQPIGRSGAPMSMPGNVPGGLSIGDEGTEDKSDGPDEGRPDKRRRRANSSAPPPPAPPGRASPSTAAPLTMAAPGNQLSSQASSNPPGMTPSPGATHVQPPQQGYPGQPSPYQHSQDSQSPGMYGNGHVLPPAGAYYAGTAPQGSPTTPHMPQHGQPWGPPPGQAVQQGAQYARR